MDNQENLHINAFSWNHQSYQGQRRRTHSYTILCLDTAENDWVSFIGIEDGYFTKYKKTYPACDILHDL